MNERDLKVKKNSIGLIKYPYDRNNNIGASKINTVCVPKNPPNISNYYNHLKTKQNQIPLMNQDNSYIFQKDRLDKTKTKNNKFKALAHKVPKNNIIGYRPQQKPIIDRPIRQRSQENDQYSDLYRGKRNKKQIIPVNKQKLKLKTHIKEKIQYFTLDNGIKQKNQWGFSYQSHNLDASALCCDEKIERQTWLQKTCRIYIQNTVEKTIPKIKTFKEQIEDFQKQIPIIQGQFQSQSLAEAIKKQQQYSQTPNYNCYLQKRQLNLNWVKRALLIDWMMDVLSELGNKRQTLAKAVSMLDRYLASTVNIPIHDLQLIGATCMLIANKLEDNVFSLSDIHKATGCNYDKDQIQSYQIIILTKLNWYLNPPTSNMWANRLAVQWDVYLQTHPYLVNDCDIIKENISLIKFKSTDQKAYYNFRWLIQYIDFSLLDIHTLQYQARTLAASFIYIVLLLRLKLYSTQQIINTFATSSQYLLEHTKFNNFFSNFLQFSFNIELIELLPAVQYCSTFVILPLNFDLPIAVKNEDIQINFQQFCSFQTRNQAYKVCLQRRNRNYD